MPCYDSRSDPSSSDYENPLTSTVRRLEGLLCEALKPEFEGTPRPVEVQSQLSRWFKDHRKKETA